MGRNLTPYNVPGAYSPPSGNVNYEVSPMNDSSVIDSPNDLIGTTVQANQLYSLNEYGPEGGYNNIISVDNITLPNSLQQLSLSGNQIITFNPSIALPNSLQYLYLNENALTSFDPSIALPSSLFVLYLYNNQIVNFNPTIALPSGLQELGLGDNQMTTAGYTASEPWANSMSVIPSRGGIYMFNNIDSVAGTDLETILIAKHYSQGPQKRQKNALRSPTTFRRRSRPFDR
jgi:Leucine-rich repeat (LRR) protein